MDPSTLVGLALIGGAVYLWFFRPDVASSLNAQVNDLFFQNQAAQQQAYLRQLEAQRNAALVGTASQAVTDLAHGNVQGAAQEGLNLLIYGIYNWARGGYEGITGNELRDAFLDQFVQTYYPGAGIERQYDAMVAALNAIGIVGSGEPGSSVPNAGDMIKMMYSGFDSATEAQRTVENWRKLFSAHGVALAVPPLSAYT